MLVWTTNTLGKIVLNQGLSQDFRTARPTQRHIGESQKVPVQLVLGISITPLANPEVNWFSAKKRNTIQ